MTDLSRCSAIVNTPPPPALIYMVSTLGKKKHKTLHDVDTDETMVPLFEKDVRFCSLSKLALCSRIVNADRRLGQQEQDRDWQEELCRCRAQPADRRARLGHAHRDEPGFRNDQELQDLRASSYVVVFFDA